MSVRLYDLVEHLTWRLFAQIVNSLKSLFMQKVLCLTDVWLSSEYVSASFFPKTLYMLLGKGASWGKKIGESRNEFWQLSGETSPKKLFLLPK